MPVTGIGDPILSLCVYFPLLSICITWLPSILVSSSHMWQDIFFYLSNHHYVYSASGIASYHIPPWSIVSDLSLAGFLNTLLECSVMNSVIHLSSPSITFLRISWEGAEIVQRISEASMISARYLLEPLSFPLFRPSFDSDHSWLQLGHHTIAIPACHTTFIDSSPHLTHR